MSSTRDADNDATKTPTPSSIPSELSDPDNLPAEGVPFNGGYYQNFSTLESAGSYATLNSSTTGCYAENGSMPILLAKKDECNLGFFCPNSTDNAPPQ